MFFPSIPDFQYHRDAIAPYQKVPQSIEHFSGKPEFLMYRQSISSEFSSFIDLHNLIFEASRILNFGCESPIFAGSQLKKLSLGSKYLKLNTKNMKVFDKFGKIEFMDTIEFYFLSVIKWITYFDEFHKLDIKDQMSLLFSIWHVWMKFQKCCVTATFRKTNRNPDEHILRNSVWDIKKARMDCTWISDYPKEYVAMYMQSQNIYEYEIMEEFVKLNPTDTELTFMFAQTCFEYAGKRFQGEILKITDGFQEVLSSDLHNYYVNERRNPRYIGRLTELMKLNNLKSIWESRPQRELSKVFDVIKVRYSHPEMFEDSEFN
ncbi:hypothetical protein CAEBREN_19499 [Caenorhabditis brenneri]|uniref:NR LBD domain-containing protein n=1 Tax=Caenorhabditis brenneri TaxID=135651 RepID=G0M9I6_CAEBE|nr:hypothetical protein CAEBREN_19499 [Caenorhabditis brenneri]